MNTRVSLLLGLLLVGNVTPNFAGKLPCSPSDSVIVSDNGKRVDLMASVSLWWTALTGLTGLVLAGSVADANVPVLTAGCLVAPTVAFLAYRNYRNNTPYVTVDSDKIQVHNFFSQPYMHWGTYSSCTPLDRESHDGHVYGVPIISTKEFLRVNGKDGSKVELQVTGLGISRDQLMQLINYYVAQYNNQDNPALDDDDDDDVPVAKARKKKK